jgi:hypothetical protein
MREPTWPNRKPPVFVRCPVCGTEFWCASPSQRWCSTECVQAAKHGAGGAPRESQNPEREMRSLRIVLTPGGRFRGVASAARHHNVSRATVLYRIRKGRPGWQFEVPDQIPAGFVPSGTPKRGDQL